MAASMIIANGVDLVTTAAELGHANATTTATIYAHQIAIARATAAGSPGRRFCRQEIGEEKSGKKFESSTPGFQPIPKLSPKQI